MRVLITRPIEDGEETARQLIARGHQPLIAPLLTVRFFEGPEVGLEGVQALLGTSANGVRALARRTARRDVALFVVGPQTAREAEILGFRDVKSANGDVHALALAASCWAEPGKGALLHVAGEGNDGRLLDSLPGFSIRQEILYAVSPVAKMPEEAAEALRRNRLDAALFYSPRSAAAFRERILEERFSVERLLAASISAATAAALNPLIFRDMRVAARPNQTALLKLLD
ncbi:MAG TPA: uroporphyrinogen-III synthase [Rhizomicrobium sp.]|nr:uroporphyrinogen-III synthase [Rhizomicrobium sp.]